MLYNGSDPGINRTFIGYTVPSVYPIIRSDNTAKGNNKVQLFYYNGAAYEKSLRRVIYIYQGIDGKGYKRVVYKKGRNVRGYRKWYDNR